MSRNNRVREYTPTKPSQQQPKEADESMTQGVDVDATLDQQALQANDSAGDQQGQAQEGQAVEGDVAAGEQLTEGQADTGQATEQPERLGDAPNQPTETDLQHNGDAVQDTQVGQEPEITKRGETAPVAILGEATFTPQPSEIPQQLATRIMKTVERDLISYMESVDPKKSVSAEHGAEWQHSLFQTIKRVVNNPDPEAFKVEWAALLAFFHKHADAMFNENYMFRFQANWKGSPKDFNQFRHLVYMAIRTANPATRKKEFNDCNFGRTSSILPAAAANNLINFYS